MYHRFNYFLIFSFLNREKIDFPRPKTCKGRLENIKQEEEQSIPMKQDDISIKEIRCLTCAGKPVKRNQVLFFNIENFNVF